MVKTRSKSDKKQKINIYKKEMVLGPSYTKKQHSLIPAISTECGIFASKNIKKNDLVLIMNNGQNVSYDFYKARAKQLKLRKNTGIGYKKKIMIDKRFTNMKKKPKWYCINHSSKPNLKLIHLDGGGAGWIALHDIPPKSELYFKYDSPQFKKPNNNEYF